MEQDDKILENLITGGVVGAALGALLSKDKREGATLGALAGAAILATFRANEEAKKSNVPLILEEEGNLYEISPDGQRRFLRKIEKPKITMPSQFKLR
ncbi:glycine zipper 2TM domain-containing protein [Flavobacterium sp. RNTU_13]|uniref:glycine zipper 2TM domain-containing protein n=1 Tax=Flavobacterium sp. RNTU_13 TaxID=3375145 RepID=UPI0039856C75